MSGAQIAHWLKAVGKGSELARILAVYRTGLVVGAGQTIAVVVGGYPAFRIGKWGYEKLMDYLQQNGYLEAAGEVV